MRTICCVLAAVLVLAGPAVVAAQPGATLTISQPADATTLDPGRSTQVLTVNYFVNLYDTLTRWDASLKLVPGLATAWKNVNETTWDFTLRPGVKFHDGTPLTAADVKATLERNMVPGKTVAVGGILRDASARGRSTLSGADSSRGADESLLLITADVE